MCNAVEALKSLILPDAMAMAVQVACILQDRNSRQSLLAFRGDEAQILVDLFHAVCPFLCCLSMTHFKILAIG